MSGGFGIGVIGMGFMGQTHARAYLADADGPGRLVAVCDPDPQRRAGVPTGAGNMGADPDAQRIFDPGTVRGYPDADALLEDERVRLVSVCTHTDTHADLAMRALAAGKHVLVEKPVSTSPDAIARLMEQSARTGLICAPAMCMRHWPGWADLRALIASGGHGRVVHARFERLGAAPAWAGGFYADTARSGGAIFDLHVHDADMACWLFGMPDRVQSVGDDRHVATQYIYQSGPSVQAQGGWLNDPAFPFRMSYLIEFERAVITFDSSRDPAMVLHASGRAYPQGLRPGSGYHHQAAAIVRAVASGDASGLPTLGEALSVTRLIESERRSAVQRRPVDVPRPV